MKLFIFVALFALACADGPPPPQLDQLHIPDKCEDVLAVKVCDRLRKTAAALKLKSDEIKTAVVEAYKKGKMTADEIEKDVKEFLVNKVLSKKCEDLTSVENCNKLRALAAQLKIKAEKVQEFIMKQIANLKTKTCEDFLDKDQCIKLDEVAAKLKIKLEKVQEMLVDAYIDAKTKGTETVVETFNKVRDYFQATKCEDMFNPTLCASFRKYAAKTKVALPRIMETAYNLVLKGASIGKGFVEKIYNIMDYFYDCEDIFDVPSCDRLRSWAAAFKVTAKEVEIITKKYVRIGIEKGTNIYKTIKDFIQNKFICRFNGNCADNADELTINKRSIFGDWKNKITEIINNKFPNLEANLRNKLQELIASSKSFYQFMKKMADEIKSSVNEKYNKYTELLKNMMVEATL